jgi:phosphatidylserine/phosphatidylglycerophosphate/cardiolipin synthase-like enzyme
MSESPEVGKSVQADRLAFIVDAADYFEAFMNAVSRARRSVLIVGWEVDSGIRLRRPDSEEADGPTLAAFLSKTLEHNIELDIHVLCWDWSMIYVLEREPWPRQKMGRDTHGRLHFELDGNHPIGASHHEKVVVIDDRVAFIGGIDLGRRRWDTGEHDPEDRRLVSPTGTSYRPFHDVQAVVSGQIARRLADHARNRWQRATGESLVPVESLDVDPWPTVVEPVIRDVPLRTIATDPAEERYETEAWHRAALDGAEHKIYLENQYLTAQAIGDALEACLGKKPAPDIVIVSSKESGGWLEQASMDAQRARIIQSLMAADPGGKLAVWWPDTGHGDSPTVHTKLSIVDDRLAYLGSANLSNRSMGLDTEIGLVMDASEDPRLEETIAGLRRSLLAEHLATTPAAVARAERGHRGLIAAVESLRSGERTLRELDTSGHPLSDVAETLRNLFDPERPADLNQLVPGLPWQENDASEDG